MGPHKGPRQLSTIKMISMEAYATGVTLRDTAVSDISNRVGNDTFVFDESVRLAGWKASREILKLCAKQQGGFVRCVPASPPGGVGIWLPAFQITAIRIVPGPALLRCHRIRNSIDCEPNLGQGRRNDI